MVLRGVKQYVQYVRQPRNRQEIETRSESLGPEVRHWRIRRDQTIDFLKRMNLDWSEGFLDIGNENRMAKEIGGYFDCEYSFTHGDLDEGIWNDYRGHSYKIVTCLDVIEHLLNPLRFLILLKRQLVWGDNRVVITYPHSNSMFWGPRHWHEFYESEFLYLLKRAGYKPLHMEKKKVNLVKTRYFWLIQEA